LQVLKPEKHPVPNQTPTPKAQGWRQLYTFYFSIVDVLFFRS
jgi:hypothetical protein